RGVGAPRRGLRPSLPREARHHRLGPDPRLARPRAHGGRDRDARALRRRLYPAPEPAARSLDSAAHASLYPRRLPQNALILRREAREGNHAKHGGGGGRCSGVVSFEETSKPPATPNRRSVPPCAAPCPEAGTAA